ncbi:ribonuclease P protein subunit p29-like [Mizuhopecten yessoensis]|uniref:Ribonuclease P protein subunit p29 n=1 Tax=Mizuhopecten yessoensis TaxID=6573 RepID=A0A210PE52_MIZYE|nr:ribonuclease P protein subunit p29-like [Mizuhopecten yessoensis]OWF34763.1 Ribonuclease P protein subunit p29 [Mizuhopecten yessoensis]
MTSPLPDHVIKHSAELGLEKNWSVKKDFVDAFLKRHLPKGRLLKGEDEEIQTKYLMLDNTGVNKVTGKKRPRKKKTLSTRECRNLKIFKVEKEGQTYDSYLPLNHLWLKYMEELTNFNSFTPSKMSNVQQRLLKADLHGSILTVQKSKCPSYVGVTGILLQETRNTFLLITKENKVKYIPKQQSVFTFTLGSYQFTIYGNNFRVRSSERAVRKFKSKATVDF